jgi:hypothetical protein
MTGVSSAGPSRSSSLRLSSQTSRGSAPSTEGPSRSPSPDRSRCGEINAIGRSRIVLGPLGFGAASIGNLYSAVDDDTAFSAVDAAWEAGVRYFDTARRPRVGLNGGLLRQVLSFEPEGVDRRAVPRDTDAWR